MWINHKTGPFSRLFHSHDKMHLLPFWVFLQSEMIDFHTVSYASTSEIHTPSHILKLENGTYLCGASLVRPL